MTGQTILHYEILEKLGEGGMGVVYKARDTRLDRFVAVKVLPADKVSDPERLRRFRQEAKTASSLNHPNIVTIHDIAGENGAQCIVMEHVRGRTLDQLIPRTGMRLSDVLKIAIQIADALAAAAAAGVIHRDLKPGNVMVTDAGLVKVLDFGLAKLTSRTLSESDETQTIASGQPRTVEGTILGTVSYMSPEQAEGKIVDARSDIFSFGAVLYEMLTGKRAFQGETQMSTLALILNHDPRAENLPREAERILVRCLRKDPARRFQTMADLEVTLEELKDEAESGSLSGTAPLSRKRTSKWPWMAAACVAAVLAAVAVWRQPRTAPAPAQSLQAVPLTTMTGVEDHPSFSPDGNQVAFDWNGEKQDNTDVYVKLVGGGSPVRLTTDPAPDFSPAWSPDGRWIAFLRALDGNRASVRLIAPLGGPERELAATANADPRASTSIAWSPDAKWLVITDRALGQPRSLALLSVESGEKRMLPALPAGAVGVDFSPAFFPDGRMLVFVRSDPNYNGLYVLELTENWRPKGEPRRVPEARGVTSTVWTPDGREILYTTARDNLWRVPASGSAAPERIVWAGDNVHSVAIAQAPGVRTAAGHRLAFARRLLDEDIWRYETPGRGHTPGAPVSLIASTRSESHPAWSPDGKMIAFTSNRSGANQIWVANADGTNPVQVTDVKAGGTGGPQWSPDGREILFDVEAAGELQIVPAGGGPARIVSTKVKVNHALYWSRDGKWLYFISHVPTSAGVWKVAVNGGDPVRISPRQSHWAAESPDGRYLYLTGDNKMWRVLVDGGSETELVMSNNLYAAMARDGFYFKPPGTASEIHFFSFETGKSKLAFTPLRPGLDMAVSPDGRWLLYSQAEHSGSDLMLVENFR